MASESNPEAGAAVRTNDRRLAVIRADASARIGGGHVVRCLALAEELTSRGWSVVFCCSDETYEVMPNLPGCAEGAGVIALDFGDVARMKRRWPSGAALLVVDHYGLDAPFESALHDFARIILAIDDFPTRAHDANILVDTTLGRRAAEYAAVSKGRALCGADYALLRRPFREARALGCRPPSSQSSDRRALVSLGLTDPDDATGFILEAISGVISNADIVLGGGAPHRERIAALVERTSGWRFHTQLSASDMAGLLVAADIVIGAAGSSSYERCCLGKPAFLLQTADNQSGNVAALVEAGVARSIGVFGDSSVDTVRHLIKTGCADDDGLARMGAIASSLVDGNGVKRVVDAVEAELSKC